MNKLFLLLALAVFVATAGTASAFDKVMDNYTGRNGSTMGSDTIGTAGEAVYYAKKYKTAVGFGAMTSINDTLTVQGSHDGTNWYDCIDDNGNLVKWTKSTLGTVKKWWDNFYTHRAAYKKTAIGNKPCSVWMTSGN